MRKLGTVLLVCVAGGMFITLAACGGFDRGDDSVSWFGTTTMRVDVDRARSVEPAMTPRQ